MNRQQAQIIRDNEGIKSIELQDYSCKYCELLKVCRVRIDYKLWVACEVIDEADLIQLALIPDDVIEAVMVKLSWQLIDGEAVQDSSGSQIIAAISRAHLGFLTSSRKSSQSSPNSLSGALVKIKGLLDAG